MKSFQDGYVSCVSDSLSASSLKIVDDIQQTLNKYKPFDTIKMLERAVALSMNRVEEAANKRPEYNKETMQYCDVGPHFDQECSTLMNLLNARQNELKSK
jgi:hypothetical protein